jgi:toxin ParE1/3/4
MNNVYLSEEAKTDLTEIKAYIERELLNPSAALNTVSRITKSLRILQDHAQAGAPLSSIADIESDYRFIVSGNYISFYRVYSSEIYIDRILYARRDYMRILFGNSTTDEPTNVETIKETEEVDLNSINRSDI